MLYLHQELRQILHRYVAEAKQHSETF